MNEDIRNNPELEINNACNYLNNIISSSINESNIVVKNKHKFIYDNYFGKNIEKKSDIKYNNINFEDITIVLCLKNRPKRFQLYYNLNNFFFKKYNVKLIVVEGKSDNMIDTTLLKKDSHITHHVVDIKNVWSRAVLLNFGVDKSTTETIILSDIDFIYTISFWDNLLNGLNYINLNKSFVGLPLYESEKTFNGNSLIRDKYTPYSACYVINKNVFVQCGGFNTKMIGFGWEERELQKRLKKNGVDTIYTNLIQPNCYVIHYSHNEKLRGPPNRNNQKLLYNSNTKKIEFKVNL